MMLRVLSITTQPMSVRETYDGIRIEYFDGQAVTRFHRPSTEFLRQGSVFDSFGNKAVRHDQWDGFVYPLPREGRVTGISRSNSRWVQQPLGQCKRGASWYYALVPGLAAVYTHVDTTSGDIYAFYCDKVVGKQMFFGSASIHLRRRTYNFSAGGQGIAQSWVDLVHSLPKPAVDNNDDAWHAQMATYAALATYGAQLAAQNRSATLSKAYGNYTFEDVSLNAVDDVTWRLAHDVFEDWTTFELSSHARHILDDYNEFGSNLLAYATELDQVGSTIRTGLGLVRGDIKPGIRAAASAWLSGRFGDRLTVADTRELLESVYNRLKQGSGLVPCRRRDSKSGVSLLFGSHWTRVRVSTVYVSQGSHTALMSRVNDLMRWDAWPTLENIWDLVPFSFVVDWFLNVADVLGQIDAAVQAPYLKSETQYASDKLTVSIDYTSSAFRVAGRFTSYARGKHNVLADIRPFESVSSSPTFGVVNLFDAGALLVQLVG